jgi:hypothetical protein
MNLVALAGTSETLKAQRLLEKRIEAEFTRKEIRDIGYPGGTERNARVLINGSHWFWSAKYIPDEPRAVPRFLNWVGVIDPQSTKVQIAVELNVPIIGFSRQISSFFARDISTDRVYLMHNGGLRGGRKGVSRDAFLAASWLPLKTVQCPDGRACQAVIVMDLGVGATRALSTYIDQVVAFKAKVRSPDFDLAASKRQVEQYRSYYPEPSGHRTGTRSSTIDCVSRHGDVVASLKEKISRRGLAGASVVKSVFIDLGIELHDALTHLYEVKTSVDRQDLYTAIGQLLVHAKSASCKRFLVVPDDTLPADIRSALDRYSVSVLRYRLTPNAVVFLDPV